MGKRMNKGGIELPAVLDFILPVFNRRLHVVRAIESCLACRSAKIESRVLIVDGGSTDGTREIIHSLFAGNNRVVLIDQPRHKPGFMNACFFGIQQVASPLATFMYSDDILSPQFVKLPEALVSDTRAIIAFGYGQQSEHLEVIDFGSVGEVDSVEVTQVWGAIYGQEELLDGKRMPVSPICCVVRSEILRKWVVDVKDFVTLNPLRNYTMIRLAGGPDLMIYIAALLRTQKYVLRVNDVVAQFTKSPDSLTAAGNKEANLIIGYWLSRIWGFQKAISGGSELARSCPGYLLTAFFYVLVQKISRFDFSWSRYIVSELLQIIALSARHGLLLKGISQCVSRLLARARKGPANN
jgi:glycosyltransferase involved in cell wall biosynthesis